MKTIESNGKVLSTKFDFEIVDKDYMNTITEEFFKKPDFDVVRDCFLKIIKSDSKNIKPITDYYFRWLMNECTRHDCKLSVNQAMSDINVFSLIYGIINRREKYFFYTQGGKKDVEDVCEAFRQYFAMGGAGVAGSVAQFPFPTVQYILNKYNVNDNYYDFSCGWGCRLTGALCNNINYYGTDPNYLLVDKLNCLYDDFSKIVKDAPEVKIFCSGSENHIEELDNKIGLAFSSTPYFKLEDYKYGNQSCNLDSYEEWKEKYLLPTISNIYNYLVDGGIFVINIKNYQKYTMEEDTVKIAEEIGFNFVTTEDLYLNKNYVRMSGTKDSQTVTITEPMFVFSKGSPKFLRKSILW